MGILGAVLGAVLGIVAGLVWLVGIIVSATIILAPIGIPLVKLGKPLPAGARPRPCGLGPIQPRTLRLNRPAANAIAAITSINQPPVSGK
ncbi:hypothetical protein Ntsu_40180 [Nocardia sp. IFM 10818]